MWIDRLEVVMNDLAVLFRRIFHFFPRLYIDTKKNTPNDDGIYI